MSGHNVLARVYSDLANIYILSIYISYFYLIKTVNQEINKLFKL